MSKETHTGGDTFTSVPIVALSLRKSYTIVLSLSRYPQKNLVTTRKYGSYPPILFFASLTVEWRTAQRKRGGYFVAGGIGNLGTTRFPTRAMVVVLNHPHKRQLRLIITSQTRGYWNTRPDDDVY